MNISESIHQDSPELEASIWNTDDWSNLEVLRLLECSDYFLSHPPKQPKKEIVQALGGDALIYDTFTEAMESWKEFLLRSEHFQDYNGSSWLIDSPLVSKVLILKYRNKHPDYLNVSITEEIENKKDWHIESYDEYQEIYEKIIACIWKRSDVVINKLLGSLFCEQNKMKSYFLHTWITKKDFIEELTFTPWKKLSGNNYWITEDNAIKWKYHIYVTWNNVFHCTYKSGDFEFLFWDATDSDLMEIEHVIYAYKSKSSHEKLDQNHNYIMEFQAEQSGNVTHLQAHRWRVDNFHPEFIIDRELEEGELETLYAIWRTPEEGIIVDIPFRFWWQWLWESKNYKWSIWLAQSSGHVMAEIISRYQIFTLFYWWSLEHLFRNALDSHFAKNLMFKWQVFSLIKERIIPDEISRKIGQIANMKSEVYTLSIRIISDGNKSYIKIMDDLSEVDLERNRVVWSYENYQKFIQEYTKNRSIF